LIIEQMTAQSTAAAKKIVRCEAAWDVGFWRWSCPVSPMSRLRHAFPTPRQPNDPCTTIYSSRPIWSR